MSSSGCVYQIGLVAGDPDLLTVRAAALLRRADLVVTGSRLPWRVRRRVRRDAEVVAAGGSEDGPADGEILPRLVETARGGGEVVRVYREAPLFSARAVADALRLAEAGVRFEIVPAPAALEVEAVRAGVALRTPAGAAGREGEDARVRLEMGRGPGVGTLALQPAVDESVVDVAGELLREGRPPEEPVLVVGGARDDRRATLAELGALAGGEVAGGASGARGSKEREALFAGEGVRHRQALDWLGRLPLRERTVVVTRPRGQAAGMRRQIEEAGGRTLLFPTIRIVPVDDDAPLRAAVRELGGYDWVVFTSSNGVRRLWSALREAGGDARAFGSARIAAIGPGTARSLEAVGLHADLLPAEFVAEALLEAILGATGSRSGERILLPRARKARSVLPDGLRRAGAQVDEVAAYRTVPGRADPSGLREAIREGRIDWLTFTASSTVAGFVERVGPAVGGAKVATIGPVTSATCRELGLPVHVEAEEHTVSGLVRALVAAEA